MPESADDLQFVGVICHFFSFWRLTVCLRLDTCVVILDWTGGCCSVHKHMVVILDWTGGCCSVHKHMTVRLCNEDCNMSLINTFFVQIL